MPTIKTDFVVSGERQYKQAISEINSGLGVLNAEMKKVTAEFQDNATSVEALTAKGDVLERQLLSQKEKVEKLRAALENAKREYGEADKRTMEWEKSLNLAEAAVAKTENAIRKNNDAMKEAKSGIETYKRAIDGFNSEIGVLDSELRKIEARYKDNTNSVEALTAKGEVLERQLISQRGEVEKMREALAEVEKQYGKTDERTLHWKKSLNDAEAAVYNTEHAIRDNNDALEKAKSGIGETDNAGKGWIQTLRGLTSEAGIKLPGGLDKALGGMQGFSAGSVAAVGAVVAAVAALIDVEKKLISLTQEVASHADDILTMSQVTGLSTDTIQELQYASNLIDVSFDTIKSSLTKLKNAMQDARDGNAKVQASFDRLGVSIVDANGELRNSEDVFYDVIDALGNVENATERDALAMDIFGRKAEDLNPLILQGSERLRELSQEAHNASYVITEEGLAALGAVDDAYQRLQLTQESVRAQIAVEMAPAVERFYESWGKLVSEAGEALIDSGIIEGLAQILDAFSGLLESSDTLLGVTLPGTEEGLKKIYPILSTIGALLASMADAIDVIKSLNPWGILNGDLFQALGFGYSSGNPNHYQEWRMKQDGTWDQYSGYYANKSETGGYRTGRGYSGSSSNFGDGYDYPADAIYDPETGRYYDPETGWEVGGHATGTMHFVGGRTVVGENGPEAVELPEGSRIWNAQDTRMGAGSGGVVINGDVILDASKVQDLVDAAKFLEDLNVVRRMK